MASAGKPSVHSLVIVHLSSLDSYADLEKQASGEIVHAFGLASRLELAILDHPGPVFIVDQAWLFIGKESWPRAGFVDSIGIPEEVYLGSLAEKGSYEQHGPQRDISWILFDEQDSEWDPFLKDLVRRLKAAGTTHITLGGLFFEYDLSEGCVTYTYQQLKNHFPTTVDLDLVGCVSHFHGKDEELPGGYTHGERGGR